MAKNSPKPELLAEDSKPVSPLHRRVITDVIQSFEHRYAEVKDVRVGGNFLLRDREGDPKAPVIPDVAVVKGEGSPPCLVVEVTCLDTQLEDLRKKDLYVELGVDELFLFDPEREYLQPRFQGFRLLRGHYVPILAEIDGALPSWATGMRLRPEGLRLRVIDTTTGKAYQWLDELEAARQAAEARRARAEARIAKDAAVRKARGADLARLGYEPDRG